MSNINQMVLEAVGPLGWLASAGAGLGGAKLHSLLSGAAAAAAVPGGLLMGIDPITAASVAGAITSGGLNLAKNFTDPRTQHDYAGNTLRALGAGVTGSIPVLGALSSFYNAGGLGYNTFDMSDEYNRHRRLQNWANQVNMIQQARAGNYTPAQ